jgi:hypothetical protein
MAPHSIAFFRQLLGSGSSHLVAVNQKGMMMSTIRRDER